jgi:LysR family transcriptional regulator, glycine cleavage system transcriptional activator
VTNVHDVADRKKPLPPFASLRAFEAVGRLAGIRRAASALGLDHAVVSRHVRTLEEWAGTPLVLRQNGATVLTCEGARYYTRIAAALAEISDAGVELISSSQLKRLSIFCVPGFAFEWLTSRLKSFHRANPGWELDVHPTDRPPDFSRHEADVDIRYVASSECLASPSVRDGVRQFEIARPPVCAVASPDCAAELPLVREPADLVHAPLLHEESQEQWQAWFSLHGVQAPSKLPGPRLWHAHMAIEAARRGQGVALANHLLLGTDLVSGRLVELPMCCPRRVTLGAYVFSARADRWQSPPVTRFRYWLKSAIADALKSASVEEHSDALLV